MGERDEERPSGPVELMTTREVADYLRLKERRIYELLRQRSIPATRVTGKWLFPKTLVDLWLARHLEGPAVGAPAPPVMAGSHDPLLEWAVKESGCELAILPGGSLDGLTRLAAGQAVAAGLHLLDPESGGYNVAAVEAAFPSAPMVLIAWAVRRQGLVLAPGNPQGIGCLADLARPGVRLLGRQSAAGSRLLLDHLLEQAGLAASRLNFLKETARSEFDLALAVLEGRADVGLAVEAVARGLKLEFLPLAEERFDLLLRRRDYFEPPLQRLFRFTRSEIFAAKADAMGGYDISALGAVRFNGP